MANVEIVTSVQRWLNVKDQWDAVVKDARASIYQTSTWLCNWWDYYGQGVGPTHGIDYFGQSVGPTRAQLGICLVWEHDALIGMAPFYFHRRFRWKMEVARSVRLIGGYHTDFIALPGKEALVGELIAKEILHERIADTIYLWDVPENSPTVNAFLATMRRDDASVHERTREERCTTLIPPSFEEFFAGLSGYRRRDYRRAMKASERLGVTVEIASRPEASLDAVMDAFFDLHCERWGAVGIVSPYSHLGRRQHMLSVVRSFHKQGWLHLVSLTHQSRIIAVQLLFFWPYNRTAYRHQDARDLSWVAFSPGKFLHITIFSHMLQAGLTRCDHGRGTEDYKMYYKPIVVDQIHSMEVTLPVRYARPLGVALNRLRSARDVIRNPARDAIRSFRSRRLEKTEREFDLKHGVKTEDYIEKLDDLNVSSRAEFRNGYHATSAPALQAILSSLQIPYDDFVFIDLGSGMGRAILMASEFPFKKIVGVEFSSELHRVAQQNVLNFRSVSQRCQNIELVCMDAVEYPVPAENTVFYLYNPFQEPIMERVLENIRRSLEDHPREILIAYYNSKYDLVEMAPFLEKVRSGATRHVPPGYQRVEQRPFAIFRNKKNRAGQQDLG